MYIIYEDDDMIVCYKEAGLPVQTASIRVKDLTDLLKVHLMTAAGENDRMQGDRYRGEPYLGIIHRIDQPVRGITVFAKHEKAAAALSAQVNNGKMKKHYSALVHTVHAKAAEMFTQKGMLTDYLLKDPRSNMSKVVPEKTKGAKKSMLEYEPGNESVFASFPEVKWDDKDRETLLPLSIQLLTGRHHQIRVQLSHAGAPIAGDRKYAPARESDPKFPCLCADALELYHPVTGKKMVFSLTQI